MRRELKVYELLLDMFGINGVGYDYGQEKENRVYYRLEVYIYLKKKKKKWSKFQKLMS